MPEASNIIKQHIVDLRSTQAQAQAQHVEASTFQDHHHPLSTTQAGKTSQPRQHAVRKKPLTATTTAPKAFAFVNISDPTESGDPDKRKFVRQYVRPVKETIAKKDSKNGESLVPRVAAVGLESGTLPFIVMSHPDQGSNAGTRKFVKQNAQKKFRKEKGRGIEGDFVEELDETEKQKAGELVPTTTKGHGKRSRILPTPKDLRSPSFWEQNMERNLDSHLLPTSTSQWNYVDSYGAIFPVKMTSTEYRLIEYLHSNSTTTKVPPAFMPLWFGLILRDKSAFQGLLSLALNQQLRCHKLPTEHTFRQYHSKALQSVRQRLADATQLNSPGLVTSVLIFLIHDILCEDEVRYKINRAGLRSIVAVRGGIESVDECFEQRVFILVVEVCGAITFNYPPDYYMPAVLLNSTFITPSFPPGRLQSLCQTWLSRYPERTQVMEALSEHYAVNEGIIAECPDLMARPGALSPPLYLVIIRYLYIVNHIDSTSPGAHLEISLCISAIVYLNVLRDAIGDYFTILSHGLITRLMDAVLPERDEWSGLEPTRLWCLVQGGIASSGTDRVRFLDAVRKMMRVLQCRNWDDAEEIVTDFIHVEQLFKKKYMEFGKEVMSVWD